MIRQYSFQISGFVDLLIIMLDTDDTKERFGASAACVAIASVFFRMHCIANYFPYHSTAKKFFFCLFVEIIPRNDILM